MNALLKQIQNKPNDISLIYKLETYIRDNWKFFSPERDYDYLIFSEVFSKLLSDFDHKLKNDHKTFKKFELVNYFKSEYKSYYDRVNKSVMAINNIVHEEVVKSCDLILTDLTDTEKLILFRYLSTPGLPKSEKFISILSKIRFKSDINDNDIISIINKTNYPSLFLIKHLGLPKYIEFTSLLNKLGIYYPITNISDDKLVLELKSKLLDKFSDNFNDISLNNISLIENLLI